MVYLASPATQQQAEHCENMPVLFSFALYSNWMDRYQQTFKRILIDSGAFSEMNTGVKIDGVKYKDWWQRWVGHADAIAGLDDINGNWRRSISNYLNFGGFPTIHDTDPAELLDDLIDYSYELGNKWIGIGLKPPRQGKENFIRRVCDRIPDDLHVHGWALREYTHIRRLDSVDSTNWFRDAMRVRRDLPWLTYGEALEIIVKRYIRWKREIVDGKVTSNLGLI